MNKQEAKKIESKILKTLKTHLSKKDTVIAAISGGPDSIFLLHFLNQTTAKIIVAHINHSLRGKDSDRDENFTRKLAEKNNNPFESKKVDLKSLSKKEKQGLEETGRKIRYKFLKKLAKEHQAKFIITGHQADDNLETIIMNFSRGALLKGLAGMKKVDNQLFRPLLDFSKKQISNYLKFKKIQYRTDKSNKDKKFTRNFIRMEIVPKLQDLNPSVAKTIAKNTDTLREIHDYLKKQAQKWIKQHSLKKDFSKFSAREFREVAPAIQRQIIMEIYRLHIKNTQDIENIHIQEVMDLLNKNIGNKSKKLGQLNFHVQANFIYVR
jgi:tRNA(Ile)-lysidine synthase